MGCGSDMFLWINFWFLCSWVRFWTSCSVESGLLSCKFKNDLHLKKIYPLVCIKKNRNKNLLNFDNIVLGESEFHKFVYHLG